MISAYEIRLIVSAQDHFSSAFRRINNDLRYMSRLQQRSIREQAELNKQLNKTVQLRKNALIQARSIRPGGNIYQRSIRNQIAAESKLATSIARVNRNNKQRRDLEQQLNKAITARQAIPDRRRDLFSKRDRLLASKSALGRALDAIDNQDEIDDATGKRRAEIQRRLDATERDLRTTDRRINRIPRLHARMQQSVDNIRRNVKAVDKEWGRAANAVKANRAELARLAEEHARLETRSKALRASAKQYGLTQRDIMTHLKAQEAIMEKLAVLEQRRARVQAVGHAGRVMTLGGGLALASAAGLANYYANFNKKVMLAATQLPEAQRGGIPFVIKSAEKLEPKILDMVQQYGLAADDLSKSAYDIYSSIRFQGGAESQFKQGLDIMQLSAMSATAGMTDLATATRANIVLANQFGSTFGEMSKNLDTVFSVVKFGNMTFADFTNMLTKTGPAATALGISLEEVGGLMAFMTKKSGKPQEAATWIARLFQTVATPEFIKGMRTLQVPIDKEGRLLPITEVMDQILKLGAANAGQGGLGMQNIIPYITSVGKHGLAGGAGLRSTIQAQRGLVFSLKDVEALKQAMTDVQNNQGEFIRSFDAMYNSAGMKWQRQIAAFKAAALELGAALIGPMTTIVGWITKLVAKFRELSPETQRLIGYFIAFGSALTMVSGVGLSVVSLLGSIYFFNKMFKVGKGVGASGAAGGGSGLIGWAGAAAWQFGKMASAGFLAVMAVNELNKANANPVPGWLKSHGLGFVADSAKWLSDNSPGNLLFPADGDDKLKKNSSKTKKTAEQETEDFIKRVTRAANRAMAEMGRQQRNDWAGKALEEVLRQTTTDSDIQKAIEQRTEQVLERQQSILQQAASNLMNMYGELKQANQTAMGGLFEGPWLSGEEAQLREEWNWTNNILDFTKDLNMQTAQFNKWRRGIAKLAKKGLPKSFLDELKKKGPKEGLPIIESILKGTPGQIKNLANAWKRQQGAINQATKIDFNSKVKQWQSLGSRMALAIAAGLKSEEFALEKNIQAMVDKMWSAAAKAIAEKEIPPVDVPKTTGVPKPSALTPISQLDPDTLYNPNLKLSAFRRRIPKGPYAGMPKTPTLRPGVPPATGNPVAGDRQTSSVKHYHTHYHVDGIFMTPKEAVDAAMLSSAARLRNKR